MCILHDIAQMMRSTRPNTLDTRIGALGSEEVNYDAGELVTYFLVQ